MELIIIFILIILNGFFTMSELAIISSKMYKLEEFSKKGNKNATLAIKLKNSPDIFLSTAQMGITLIGILTGIFSGQKITDDFTAFIKNIPYISNYSEQIGVIGVIFFVTLLSIIFGELIPKRLGLIYPEKLALVVAKPINIISIITKPFIWLLSFISNSLMKLFGYNKEQNKVYITENEIKAMVRSSVDFGEVETIEEDILNRTFILGDREVDELMTYRTDIKYISINSTIDEIKAIVKEEPHSFYPVINDDDVDDIIGVINIKELFYASDNFNINDVLKEAIFIPDTMAAFSLLAKFKEAKTHFAIVVDEYGGTRGIITISDMVDALIGDISSEDEYEITKNGEEWLVDGQYPYFQLLNYFELEEEEEVEYNTIAGLILDELSSIPSVGDKVQWYNYEITVVDMDGNRIDKISIKVNEREKEYL